jgi:hypothetical protein
MTKEALPPDNNPPAPREETIHSLMEIFDELSFREKWARVFKGIRQPKDTGEYKYARLQLLRLLSPAAAVVVPVLVFALITLLGQLNPEPTRAITVTVVEPETMEELEEIVEPDVEPLEPPEPTELQMDISADMPSLPNETVSPPADVASVQPAEFDSVAMVKSPVQMRGMLGSRTPGTRGSALAGYGGSGATEQAVMLALRWLKKYQEEDGAWRFASGGLPPQVVGELYAGNPEGFTGLALLTFLAHGETPGSEEFGETVQKALQWLLANQKPDGTWNNPSGDLGYSHAIATYAMCEAAAMTAIPDVKYSAAKGVDYLIQRQFANGGWNYLTSEPGARQDVSVTAWCVQALKAAKLAGLGTSGVDEALQKALSCFTTVLFNSTAGAFNYQNNGDSGLGGRLTCAAVLSLQLAGAAERPECRAGLRWLEQNATCEWTNPWGRSPLYYWYYTTQAMFHEGGETWKKWNAKFAPQLVRNQTVVKNAIQGPDGKLVDIGYWMPIADHVPPEYCQAFVYNTTLCALQLQVYYRYLPTFKTPEASTGVKAALWSDDDIEVEVQ